MYLDLSSTNLGREWNMYIAIYSHEAYLARSGNDMASLYPARPVRSGYNGLTHDFYSISIFFLCI